MSDKLNLLINYKVLYVEDDDFHREQLQMFLKRRVGKLFTAKNGKEGLEVFESQKPDIIVTDLKMPVMDGIEMSKKIREKDKKCPIIITTAFSDVETILGAVDIGIDKYVLKPIDTKELMKAMEDSAVKLTEGRTEDFILGDKIIIDKKEKLEYEGKIQIKIAYFIKSNTGKGPKSVKAFIKGNLIEIEAIDPLTIYEKKLLEYGKNKSLVNFSREAFYNDRKNEIEKIIFEILGVKCTLERVSIDLKNNRDILVISL
jgi:YesN/AraC family two-component response regulator